MQTYLTLSDFDNYWKSSQPYDRLFRTLSLRLSALQLDWKRRHLSYHSNTKGNVFADYLTVLSRFGDILIIPFKTQSGLLLIYVSEPGLASNNVVKLLDRLETGNLDDPEGWTVFNSPHDACTSIRSMLDTLLNPCYASVVSAEFHRRSVQESFAAMRELRRALQAESPARDTLCEALCKLTGCDRAEGLLEAVTCYEFSLYEILSE